jgi:hypothetical protein
MKVLLKLQDIFVQLHLNSPLRRGLSHLPNERKCSAVGKVSSIRIIWRILLKLNEYFILKALLSDLIQNKKRKPLIK